MALHPTSSAASSSILTPENDVVVNTSSETKIGRIVGGVKAKKGEFPFYTQLQEGRCAGGRVLCGGSLVDRMWVLTAAQCSKSDSFCAHVSAYADATVDTAITFTFM